MLSSVWDSSYIVPVVALMIPIAAIITGGVSQYQRRRLQSEERLAAIARGIPLPPEPVGDPDSNGADPFRRVRSHRTGAIVLISVGVGLAIFGFLLARIVEDRDVLIVAAAAIIPFTLGVGFFIDYRIRNHELNRSAAQSSSTALPPRP